MSEMPGKKPFSRDEVLAALPGYVLDALTPEEKRALDEYLRRRRELTARVRELDWAVSAMALSAPEKPLPAGMKQSIIQRVRADVQSERPRLAGRPHRAVSPEAVALPTVKIQPGPGIPPTVRSDSWTRRVQRWWEDRRYANLALGLSGALAVLLLFVLLQAQNVVQQSMTSHADLRVRVATLETENQSLRSENQVLQEAVTTQRQQWATILAANEAVTLAGTDDAPASQAVFYAGGSELLLLAAGLAPLSEEQTYQLWLIPADGDPVSAGLFDVAADGLATFQGATPLPASAYAAVGVSIEPAGGSATPTGPIVLLGEVG